VPSSIWNHYDDPNFGLANLLSRKINLRQQLAPSLLADVRSSRELLVACDFGGAHKRSGYQTYSFLVGAISGSGEWDGLRNDIRERLVRDNRRMSYKTLGDAIRARSLLPFLKAADKFPGVLMTFLVDKRINRLVGDHRSPDVFPELVVAERGWNQNAFHKLCLVASLGSLLIRGLSGPTQDILWLTDQDEIAPNPTKHDHAGHVIHHHISTYASQNKGRLVFVTTEADITGRRLEDVVAIPDLAAGALGETFSAIKDKNGQGISRVWVPFPTNLPRKADLIATWFFNPPQRLSKLAIIIEPCRGGGLTAEIVSALTMANMTA
jgi:hypothetical protein